MNGCCTGNYAAVGTFDPEIEIWDLDTVDAMYPDAILGETGISKSAKKKQQKQQRGKVS